MSLLALTLAVSTNPAFAGVPVGTIVVNSTGDTVADDGFCTLREAIISANTNAVSGNASGECAAGSAAPAIDTIAFNIPGTDSGCVGSPKVCTIKPASTLPQITEPVFINGYSQPGSSTNTLAIGDNAVLLIELDATNLSPALFLSGAGNQAASKSTIRGLVVSHIGGNGICISCSFGNNASDITIAGNFLGTDRTGTVNTSGGTPIASETSTGATVGGPAPADRNVISSNSDAINFNASSSNVVKGNYIGIDAAGTSPTSAQYGVHLVQGSSGNQIGGSAAGEGNVFGAHSTAGIWIDGSGSGGNKIQGNLIGTDATGTVGVAASGGAGIVLGSNDAGNQIGGEAPGEGNVISGNGQDGISIIQSPTGILIQGNKIGTDFSGAMAIPNFGCGIDVGGSSTNTNGTIGGTSAGAANVIAFNITNGVSVSLASNTGWEILGNSIWSNADMGIVLGGRCNDLTASPTPNDDGDADTGPNNLQNYPVITAVTIGPKTMAHVSGSLNSTADTKFRVEFFANAGCELNGHGEGKVFVGSSDVTTIGNDVSFGVLDIPVPAHRHVITSTATDPAGNTSEFSACSLQDTIFTDGLEND